MRMSSGATTVERAMRCAGDPQGYRAAARNSLLAAGLACAGLAGGFGLLVMALV
ncbi:hypothetical protein [Salinarimonas sp.]|uniref:hypothetical protein n=1 Tax=Salinarimonas sp. TaxID=2766526 RepID=UPI0032D9682A